MSQKNNYKNNKRNKNKTNQGKNYCLLPIILVLFVPLIMYYHGFDTKLGDYPWFGAPEQADVFLYYKMVAIIVISLGMLFILGGYFYHMIKGKKEERFKSFIIWIPLGLYGVLSLLSTVFSEYSYWGYHGMVEQMEPVWVLLGYGLITLYAFVYIREQKDTETVIKWMMISGGILSLIGALQAFSLDFYRTTLGKMTYLPAEAAQGNVEFVFEKGRTYTSLYNPNYVGVYACLLIPLIITLILTNKNRKLYKLYLPVLLCLVISLFGAASKSGILCLTASFLILILLFRKQLLKRWKISLCGILFLILTFFGINALKDNALLEGLKTALHPGEVSEPILSRIETNDENVTITYNHNKMIVAYNPEGATMQDQIILTDEQGSPITTIEEAEDTFLVEDERFAGITLSYARYEEMICFGITVNGRTWYFTNQKGDNTYYYVNTTGKLDKMQNPEYAKFFKGKENFASGRGFIWSRTLPLMKDHIFLGSGADSFVLVYPNSEYLGKENYGFPQQNITKPHCLYLQMGVQTGLLSLLAFLVFYAMYFFSSIRLYMKSKLETYESQIGAAILTGTFGYMIMGISNDSSIGVAPIFWLMMGMGLAINYRVKNNFKE
ncbi:MAG: O-antigen ligase family protein [Acetivibrio sp.]